MVDLATLWDFDDPAGSEARLRVALVGATAKDAAVLRTQVARTLGLQEQYGQALAVLDGIESVDPEVHVRILLERGRIYRSSGEVAASGREDPYVAEEIALLAAAEPRPERG